MLSREKIVLAATTMDVVAGAMVRGTDVTVVVRKDRIVVQEKGVRIVRAAKVIAVVRDRTVRTVRKEARAQRGSVVNPVLNHLATVLLRKWVVLRMTENSRGWNARLLFQGLMTKRSRSGLSN
ncbi:MAG: hypothetical protein BWY82_00883 [Verrucomicrobia bacterium ADurb.Bin474]|nr:MAG: hypothetical protein BWY82_00883 [Verrucomicrobia bacterium ADurb.Bin474]